jgi:hypothetical protein
MKTTRVLPLVACALALAASPQLATAAIVNLSMNVFPTNLANPNGGGTWRIVAKTDSTQGIAGISAYLNNVNVAGLGVEPDIGSILNGGNPFVTTIGSVVNIVYGQNTATGPLVAGVGTLATSDGPDPLGNPVWNDATRIFSGNYSSIVPSFAIAGINETDANTFAQVIVGLAALDADTRTVVRVAVPEPATMALALFGVMGAAAVARRRR